MEDNKTFVDAVTFLDAVGGMPGITTIKVNQLNIRNRDGKYWLEVVPEPVVHEIGVPMAAYGDIAREQYRRERDQAGDPPYSIGNEWLLEFADKCS